MSKPLVVFENRAWEKAEHPRLVSNRVPVVYEVESEPYKSVVFEIGRHYPKEKYMIQSYCYRDLDKIQGKLDPCSGGYEGFYNTVQECLDHVSDLGYQVQPINI